MPGAQQEAEHEHLRQAAQRILQHQLAQPHEGHRGGRHHLIEQAGEQGVGQQQGNEEEQGARTRNHAVTGIHIGLLGVHAFGFKIIKSGHLQCAGQHIGVERSVVGIGKLVKVQRLLAVHLVLVPHVDGADELGGESLASGNLAANLGHVHGCGLVHAAVGEAELEDADAHDEEGKEQTHAHQEITAFALFCGSGIHSTE